MNVPFIDLNPINRQIGAELDDAWHKVKQRGVFIQGDYVSEFEDCFAKYCETSFAVGVGNGLDAIALTLQALSIGAGDEVIVPANTFIATWLAVTRVGARAVPADCDNQTGNLLPEAARLALSSRTKAIIAVHLYGAPAAMDELSGLADKAGVFLIEDAAQAHGARYKGRRVGSFGVAAAFSFYPTKNLGAFGDGGAIVTRDKILAERIRLLGNYGSPTKYHHELQGSNSRLDELQAAILLLKLKHLDKWNEERRAIAARYISKLDSSPCIRPLTAYAGTEPVWHLFAIRSHKRDDLAKALRDDGVQTVVHYPLPPHLQPAFAEMGLPVGSFPVAEQIAKEVLSLPMWPGMSSDQIDHVAESAIRASASL